MDGKRRLHNPTTTTTTRHDTHASNEITHTALLAALVVTCSTHRCDDTMRAISERSRAGKTPEQKTQRRRTTTANNSSSNRRTSNPLVRSVHPTLYAINHSTAVPTTTTLHRRAYLQVFITVVGYGDFGSGLKFAFVLCDEVGIHSDLRWCQSRRFHEVARHIAC